MITINQLIVIINYWWWGCNWSCLTGTVGNILSTSLVDTLGAKGGGSPGIKK